MHAQIYTYGAMESKNIFDLYIIWTFRTFMACTLFLAYLNLGKSTVHEREMLQRANSCMNIDTSFIRRESMGPSLTPHS